MYAICRINKLKSAGNLGGLNAHLTRTMPVPNADSSKAHLNQRLVGSDDLNSDVQTRIAESKCKVRKDSVLAIEYLLTASPEYFNGGESVREFKNKASEWLVERHGLKNVVNVHLHMDEKTPHIHAVVVPLDQRDILNAKSFTGGRKALIDMQDSFADTMKPLGLDRGINGSKAEHTSIQKFYSIINESQKFGQEPEVYEVKKPSGLDLVRLEKWTQEQNELIRRSIENLRKHIKEEAQKPILKRSKELLDARGGEAFKKAERDLKAEFNKEAEGKRLKYNGLVNEYNSLLESKQQWQQKAETLEKKYEPKIEPEQGRSKGRGI